MIQKTAAIFCTVLMVISFGGCKDSEKEKYEKEVEISVTAEATSLGSLEEEIEKIAYEHDEGGVLTYAQAVFNGEKEIASQKGLIYFTYCRNDEENKLGTTVTLTYDMNEKMVTKVVYEQGKGQFDEKNQTPILEDFMNFPFDKLFETIRNDSNMGGKLKGKNVCLTIEFDSEAIIPSLI